MNAQSRNDEVSRRNDRNIRTTENQKPSLWEKIIVFCSWLIFVLTFPVAIFWSTIVVREFQRVIVFRLGRLRKGARGPGIVFILPCIDRAIIVDLRTTWMTVKPQDVLTKDSVTVKIDAVVYYRIFNPLNAVIQINNVYESTESLAQTTLRNITGTKNLMELLISKEAMSLEIARILDEATDPWGIKVEHVEITDIALPKSMQRSLAAEAEAVQEAKAKLIAAEGEMSASLALKEASDVMSQNPIALQLRCLQTLRSISAECNSTIIFPFLVDLLPET